MTNTNIPDAASEDIPTPVTTADPCPPAASTSDTGPPAASSSDQPAASTSSATVSPGSCRTCQYHFADRDDQVLHYKLDWHAYNVKQVLQHGTPISELEFDARCDDDLSSLSGDESESEGEEFVTSHFLEETPELTGAVVCSPHLVFQFDGVFYKSLYSLFFSSNVVLTDDTLSQCVSRNSELTSNALEYRGRIAVFLYSAQHFAGAVYENDKILLHKTYHRYTVRAKQGTVQGIRDGKGNAPKSHGASLRRYNQIALHNDVEAMLLQWADTLADCSVVFHRTAVHNKHVFDKLKDKLNDKISDKIRSIPFTTYRPTLKEAKRVYGVLTRITPSSDDEFSRIKLGKELQTHEETKAPVPKAPQPLNPKSIPNSHLKQRPDKPCVPAPQLEEPELKPWYENEHCIFYKILESLSANNYEVFTALICGVDLAQAGHVDIDTSREFVLAIDVNTRLDDANTLLHHAASATNHLFTSFLLHQHANPELKNIRNKVPYDLAGSKDVRDEFRRFMGRYPNKWDYQSAKVPSPLTPAMEQEQENKKKERRKAQRAAKSVRDKEKKEAAKVAAKHEEEKLVSEVQALRMRGLSARERCLLAAEARLAEEAGTRGSKSGKCANCDTGLDGLVPFERVELKFCSVTCVKEHKDTAS